MGAAGGAVGNYGGSWDLRGTMGTLEVLWSTVETTGGAVGHPGGNWGAYSVTWGQLEGL